MQQLFDELSKAASNPRAILRLIPLIVGENRLELRSMFENVLEPRISGQKAFVYECTPAADDFDMDEPRIMLFLQGDRIGKDIQARLLRRQSVTYVLAAVSKNTTILARDGLWDELFRRSAAGTLVWPPWSVRKADQNELIRFMHARLRMPAGRTVPELGASAMGYLLAKPFKGTDEVDAELKRGLQAYINGQHEGPLTSAHFAGTQIQRAMEGRGDVRRQPSEPPQAG